MPGSFGWLAGARIGVGCGSQSYPDGMAGVEAGTGQVVLGHSPLGLPWQSGLRWSRGGPWHSYGMAGAEVDGGQGILSCSLLGPPWQDCWYWEGCGAGH